MALQRLSRKHIFISVPLIIFLAWITWRNRTVLHKDDGVEIDMERIQPGRNFLDTLRDHTNENREVIAEVRPAFFRNISCEKAFPGVDEFRERLPVININKTSIFYCGIPKVGSSFTKELLSSIPKCEQKGLCEINIPTKRWTNHPIAKHAFSFMWIRDPYSRLFAAYESKLYRPNKFWRTMGRDVVRTVRKEGPSLETMKIGGYDATFAEFIRYILILAHNSNLNKLNTHFRQMHKLCNACDTRFDFIGRLENFSEAIDHVCSKFDEIGLLEGMEEIRPCDSSLTDDMLFHHVRVLFEILSNNVALVVSKLLRREIMLRTWSGYQIRGLLSKAINMPFTDDELSTVTKDQYMEALRGSMKASNNNTELKAQRHEAMLQAYMTVPMEDMVKLKEYVKTDCLLFGYDPQPAELFKARNLHNMQKSMFGDFFGGLLNRKS